MKYEIVAGNASNLNGIMDFEKQVQKALDKGWKPLGGVAISGNQLLQALTGDRDSDGRASRGSE